MSDSFVEVTVTVNGDAMVVVDGTSVSQLVGALGLEPSQIAIELNLNILPKALWQETRLVGGDKIELVHFVGGGLMRFPGAGAKLGVL